MVCHDGSDASIGALNTVHRGFLRDCDHIIVAHAWSKAKEESGQSMKFKRDYIHEQNAADFAWMGEHRFRYIENEIIEPETAKTVLKDIIVDSGATMSVVGWHGRKGPKMDATVMGSGVEYALSNLKAPVMIVKKPLTR